MEISELQHTGVVHGVRVDANVNRERQRQRRLRWLAFWLAAPFTYWWYRRLTGDPIGFGLPPILRENPEISLMIVILLILCSVMLLPYLGAGKSPHTVLRASDSNIRLADVVGAAGTRREAIDTLNLFLNHETFAKELGGSARRGVLFEGPPGTGKTYLAKAMAAEAGVPFLFVSGSEFQSMFYGQTNRKVRSFFKSMRKMARAEGGAIGFIEEFDSIGGARSGMGANTSREGSVGVVNELLVQMQSFDLPTGWQKFKSKNIDRINSFLPVHRALRRPVPKPANVLVIAATNRAADIDPALLRPGRFDRTIHFDLPPRADRVEIADYYLARKTHDAAVTAERIADLTPGYSPVRIERLLDEALIVSLRHNRRGMSYDDVMEAQLTIDVGLAHEVGYQPEERRRVAVHEAGHALVAVLTGRDVKIATILRRASALGLVAHGDAEERYLKTPSEAHDLIAVAMAGRAAEIQEFGEASSGIASDLTMATAIACQLVGVLGACDSLLSLEASQHSFGGNLVSKVLEDLPSRKKADEIMKAAADRAACMVLEHRTALMALAEALVTHDELSGDDVHNIVAVALTS